MKPIANVLGPVNQSPASGPPARLGLTPRLLCALAVGCAATQALADANATLPPDTWLLKATPVRVEAHLLYQDPASATATLLSAPHRYVFTITVHGSPLDQILTSAVSAATLEDAVKLMRGGALWRSPYLYVHIERGVGARPDSSREAIFELTAGQLRPLGQLVDKGEAPTWYSGRRFTDYWETAASQVVTVKLMERDGKLEVRRGATWSANQDAWTANAQLIAAPPSDVDGNAATPESFSAHLVYFQAVLSNAMLAKYCMKTAELTQLLSSTASHLNAQQRQDLQEGLATVRPLTPPSEARPALYALNVPLQTAPQVQP